MAVTAPTLTTLPDPPLPTDAEADFDAKAGASLTAQVVMVVEINSSLTWIATQVNAAEGFKNAAATSAGAAAGSASAANTSKNAAAAQVSLAAGQVVLAANQVVLANNAKSSAEVAAAAAQAAAGLPSLVGNANKVLRVNAGATAVGWGVGLPALPAAAGKTLVVSAGGTAVEWAEQYKVGDVLMSARNPGALWLPADGAIRAQSSYPVLFAALGLIGNSIGSVWASVALPIPMTSSGSIATGKNGTTIAMSASGVVTRSLDKGVTWGPSIASGLTGTLQSLATNGAGVWIATNSNSNGVCVRSLDDGLTWSNINLPTTTSSGHSKVIYVGGTSFVAMRAASYSSVSVSNNNGASWSTVVHNGTTATASGIGSDENGVVLLAVGVQLSRSVDYGQTWTIITAPASAIAGIATDSVGNWVISGGNGNTNTYVSNNNAQGFTLTPMGATPSVIDIVYMDGAFFLRTGNGAGGTHYTYKDGVFTPLPVSAALGNLSHAGNNILLALSTNIVYRGLPYSYDTATQFQLPAPRIVAGVKSYIKALEAA